MIDHLLQIRVLQIQSMFYKSNPVRLLQYALAILNILPLAPPLQCEDRVRGNVSPLVKSLNAFLLIIRSNNNELYFIVKSCRFI